MWLASHCPRSSVMANSFTGQPSCTPQLVVVASPRWRGANSETLTLERLAPIAAVRARVRALWGARSVFTADREPRRSVARFVQQIGARASLSRSHRRLLADVGGVERCSEIKLSLIRRLAAVVVQAELGLRSSALWLRPPCAWRSASASSAWSAASSRPPEVQ
jgi:hypothetical protein